MKRDLIKARDDEFRRRCVEIFKSDYNSGAIRPLDSVLERAMACQPHCHYLSYDTASRRLHEIERYGLEAIVRERIARQMWTELAAQVADVMALHPRKSFNMALSFVLNFCRPSRFFISVDTARRIIAPNITYNISLGRG